MIDAEKIIDRYKLDGQSEAASIVFMLCAAINAELKKLHERVDWTYERGRIEPKPINEMPGFRMEAGDIVCDMLGGCMVLDVLDNGDFIAATRKLTSRSEISPAIRNLNKEMWMSVHRMIGGELTKIWSRKP